MTKPWRPLCQEEVDRLGGQLGVYEIATHDGDVVLIGYAGGRSLFGLSGELHRELAARGEGTMVFRTETTMAYLTRWRELLMVHEADHGRLPPENENETVRLGHLSPG